MTPSAHLLRENTDSVRSSQWMRVSLDLRFLLGLSVFARVAASASRAAAIPSKINCSNNSSGTKKYRGSNSSDGGNAGDRVKIIGGVIGSGDGIVSFDKIKVECFNFQKIRHFARDCRATGNQDSRRRDAGNNGNKTRDNGRRPAYQDDSKSLVTIDREDIDWSGHVEEDAQNYAIMGYSSSKSGNYMPSGPDVEIDYSNFTYGPKQTSTDESESKPSEYASCESDSSVETSTSMPETKENASKVVCKPKVWTDAPIIEEYESDSDNDSMSNVQEDKEKPSFAFTDFVKHV
nr:hypothetical protein [Tanacetum cinerariifolium]